jgi:hypothetical protein
MFEFVLFAFGLASIYAGAGIVASAAAPHRASPPTIVHYRTRDGLCDYSFSIKQRASGRFRSYIISQPDYGSRSTDAHSTHRHWDVKGRAYVCWSKPITSEEDALRVCAAWADATQEYIKFGTQF